MALAVEEGKLPLVLPSSVARVTANGLPTKHLIDWEQLTRHWYKANAVALDTRLTEVKSETDANTAAITEEATARTSADEALALQITEVTATVDDATANGQIYFAAKAAPGGAVAAYGLYLTAGSTFTGMELIADSGGGASIAFAANDFKLTDSGTAQNVFNYSSGVFTFNVPVRVGTIDIAQQAVTVPVTAYSAGATVGPTGGSWVTLLTATLTGGSGYSLILYTDFSYRVVSGTGTINGQWRVLKDGGAIPRNGVLSVFTNYNPVFAANLDVNIPGTHTYEFQVFVSTTGTATFEFINISFLLDLRKR